MMLTVEQVRGPHSDISRKESLETYKDGQTKQTKLKRVNSLNKLTL